MIQGSIVTVLPDWQNTGRDQINIFVIDYDKGIDEECFIGIFSEKNGINDDLLKEAVQLSTDIFT